VAEVAKADRAPDDDQPDLAHACPDVLSFYRPGLGLGSQDGFLLVWNMVRTVCFSLPPCWRFTLTFVRLPRRLLQLVLRRLDLFPPPGT
jgi:hypothetical protein